MTKMLSSPVDEYIAQHIEQLNFDAQCNSYEFG